MLSSSTKIHIVDDDLCSTVLCFVTNEHANLFCVYDRYNTRLRDLREKTA